MNDIALRMFVGLQTELAALSDRAKDRLAGEDGAVTVETVTITGIMVVIIVALFLTDTVGIKSAMLDLGRSVVEKIRLAGSS